MRISQVLDRLLTAVMVGCALLVAGMAARAQFGGPAKPEIAGASSVSEETVRRLAIGADLLGEQGAKVRIVEFSDFQCPFCARMRERLEQLQRDSDNRVAIVYRHFPLDFHTHAFEAAVAARCAGEQGQFAPMHDQLFINQDSIGKRTWSTFAVAAKVKDMTAFDACMAGPVARRQVRADLNEANRLKLQGTPALLIGGTVIVGEPAAGVLEDLVRAELRRPLPQ